jgi:glycosyltransferase involved in cell wall biosynthesis
MMSLRGPVKHIAFAHRKLSFGGGERVLIEQVAALAELPLRVSILFSKGPDQRDIEAELRARNPHVGEVRYLPGTIQAWRWLRANRPDLLVVCNHKGLQRALPWIGRRIPTLVTLHEHYHRHLAKYRGIRRRVDRWLITWPFQDQVRALLGDQPCSLIHPLYPRPEVAAASAQDRAAARGVLGLPGEALVVGYVGQMDGRKDPVSTLRLAEALERALGRPLHLLFAGREAPATREELDRAVAASPLRDRVHRLGPLPDVGPAFQALDLYLMTSRNEGFFPIALVEALERGVPVVAPTVGGIATVLRDGAGGFLIPKPDDRKPIPVERLQATAARVAPLLLDPVAWQGQRDQARALAQRLTVGYDAATRFREALSPWL